MPVLERYVGKRDMMIQGRYDDCGFERSKVEETVAIMKGGSVGMQKGFWVDR